MTPTEAAEVIGVTRQRVHQMIQEGRVDCYRAGQFWLISRASVADYAALDR